MSGPAAPDRSRPVDREELFQLVVESATDFAIITMDNSGIITSWNIGAERLIGYSEAEIVGANAEVIFIPDDRAVGMPQAEQAAARRDGRAEDERWHQRKNGSMFWGSGLMMPLRGGEGFVKIMRDRTAQRLTEERLRESEERFRTLALNIPALVFRTRHTGSRIWGSPQWEAYTGLPDERSRDFGWLDAIHPADVAATMATWRRAGETGSYLAEHRVLRQSDRQYRWHQTRASPYSQDRAGEDEWVGTSIDVHEMRGLQSRQQVLLAELQHRTRNLLAVVQAIAKRTLRSARSLEMFGDEFEHRLIALARVQGLISDAAKETLSLRAIVEAELAAHGDRASEKIRIDGPDIEIPTSSAQTLALALHELATNAVKYGALGQPAGRLSLNWRAEPDEAQPTRIVLEWLETGVSMPPPAEPRRKGYGTELIERALQHQLNARTTLTLGADGVRCVIEVPIPPPAPIGNVPGETVPPVE